MCVCECLKEEASFSHTHMFTLPTVVDVNVKSYSSRHGAHTCYSGVSHSDSTLLLLTHSLPDRLHTRMIAGERTGQRGEK